MSHPPTSSHSVQLVSAKYLESHDLVAESEAAPMPKPVRRKASPLLLVMRLIMVMLLAASIPMVVYGKRTQTAASLVSGSGGGVNWLLSIFGSEKSFEQMITSAIDSANRDVERPLKEQESASVFAQGKRDWQEWQRPNLKRGIYQP